ncbi:MAG: hypothetical protein IT477_11250 [Rhodanobacteraceae bacterium]|nr:hypothetical protein [Rhodanobacteraceae bacterium]
MSTHPITHVPRNITLYLNEEERQAFLAFCQKTKAPNYGSAIKRALRIAFLLEEISYFETANVAERRKKLLTALSEETNPERLRTLHALYERSLQQRVPSRATAEDGAKDL